MKQNHLVFYLLNHHCLQLILTSSPGLFQPVEKMILREFYWANKWEDSQRVNHKYLEKLLLLFLFFFLGRLSGNEWNTRRIQESRRCSEAPPRELTCREFCRCVTSTTTRNSSCFYTFTQKYTEWHEVQLDSYHKVILVNLISPDEKFSNSTFFFSIHV